MQYDFLSHLDVRSVCTNSSYWLRIIVVHFLIFSLYSFSYRGVCTSKLCNWISATDLRGAICIRLF
jgi:hypothetical protein